MIERRIVLISGAPAAGKTSLARPLAKLLELPLIAEFDRPMGLGPVIDVDTTRPVDVKALADQVAALFGRGVGWD